MAPSRSTWRVTRSLSSPRLVWDASYEIDLGPHVFVTAKYRLTRERLLKSGAVREDDFVAPSPASREELLLAHSEAYVGKIEDDSFSIGERMQLEIPFTSEVRDAMTLACGGTTQACAFAIEHGSAGHLGGGFHHAYAGHGEGFCLLNDGPIAMLTLIERGTIERGAIVDLDVHHGNGTASILAGNDAVFTFSMHQENNYPAYKPPSDLDIGLEDWTGDEEYLGILEGALPEVLDTPAPELVLYLAGADPYREDQLGGLGLTREGLRRRDRMVFEAARNRGLPIAVVLAGGYAIRLEDTVSIHTATIEELIAASG